MARLIKVFEHERLTTSPNDRGEYLTMPELERLWEFNDRNGHKYFTGIRNGIKFKNYVGVIQVGSLTLEILPKADNIQNPLPEDYEKWRKALLRMLAICRLIKVESVSQANLDKRFHSLLDLYFDLFLDEVTALLKRGLIKKYRNKESNTLALKGRIHFGKHIQRNLVHQERFYNTHQVYDYENLANQILLRALSILPQVSCSLEISQRVKKLKLDFPEITEIQITKTHFDKLKESRKTVMYSEALKIAKMIILNYSPDIKNGQENMLALLFDMNKLWEEYIYKMLERSKPDNIQVNSQEIQEFWETKTIRPDIVITRTDTNPNQTFVIDTKWKLVDYNEPNDDDLKQMYAYNMYWDAEKSMLIYPEVDSVSETFGTFYRGRTGDNKCKLGFVSVLDAEGKLNMNVGETIFRKLEIQ